MDVNKFLIHFFITYKIYTKQHLIKSKYTRCKIKYEKKVLIRVLIYLQYLNIYHFNDHDSIVQLLSIHSLRRRILCVCLYADIMIITIKTHNGIKSEMRWKCQHKHIDYYMTWMRIEWSISIEVNNSVVLDWY